MREALLSTSNDTKWEELRLAMHEMRVPPAFRCKDLSGFYSEPDREWFYHFRNGGYQSIEYVDVLVEGDPQRQSVLAKLRRIGLAGEANEQGFRVFGYVAPGQAIEYF